MVASVSGLMASGVIVRAREMAAAASFWRRRAAATRAEAPLSAQAKHGRNMAVCKLVMWRGGDRGHLRRGRPRSPEPPVGRPTARRRYGEGWRGFRGRPAADEMAATPARTSAAAIVGRRCLPVDPRRAMPEAGHRARPRQEDRKWPRRLRAGSEASRPPEPDGSHSSDPQRGEASTVRLRRE